MKSIEETIKSNLRRKLVKNTDSEVNSQRTAWYDTGFKEGVEFAQRWISVEEELPEVTLSKGDKSVFGHNVTALVLVDVLDDGIKVTKRVFVKGKWIWPADYKVIRWRPIFIY